MNYPARNLRYLIPAALSLFVLALLTGCSGNSDALRAIAGHNFSAEVYAAQHPPQDVGHHQLHVRLRTAPRAGFPPVRASVHSL